MLPVRPSIEVSSTFFDFGTPEWSAMPAEPAPAGSSGWQLEAVDLPVTLCVPSQIPAPAPINPLIPIRPNSRVRDMTINLPGCINRALDGVGCATPIQAAN